MRETTKKVTPRREFLIKTSQAAAASTLAAAAVPRVHGAEENTIQVALVGCGRRGTGAAPKPALLPRWAAWPPTPAR